MVTRRASSRLGFTVVELLIAAAILGIILTLLGSLFVGARRSYAVSEQVAEERQVLQTATELLAYEIGLAGFRGTDVSVTSIATARAFTDRPLVVSDGASGAPDSVTVRYFEDRFVAGSPELVEVTFTVQNGSLVRVAGGATSVLVDDVLDLQVTSWLNRAATEFVVPTSAASANRPPDPELAGLGLTLVLAGRSAPYVLKVALRNPQCQSWPCP